MRGSALHGQDRETNFPRFFTKSGATGTSNTPALLSPPWKTQVVRPSMPAVGLTINLKSGRLSFFKNRGMIPGADYPFC